MLVVIPSTKPKPTREECVLQFYILLLVKTRQRQHIGWSDPPKLEFFLLLFFFLFSFVQKLKDGVDLI
jgi:hypothetical protein